ncbi:MAG TPA: GIY-YIG nuclease family protein [Steroidobacteraceae bacterium]|nr:GIY-YIG nuclease family protein [Steroidobacteraceae bacterium]
MNPVTPKCVYVFAAREFVKIGVSVDPMDRWKAILTANPMLEDPIFISQPVPYAFEAESMSHRVLRPYLCKAGVAREWFNCDCNLAVETVKVQLELCRERNARPKRSSHTLALPPRHSPKVGGRRESASRESWARVGLLSRPYPRLAGGADESESGAWSQGEAAERLMSWRNLPGARKPR